MAYKALVSITFEKEDIDELKSEFGARFDLQDWIFGELQNLSHGCGWVESIEEFPDEDEDDDEEEFDD